MGFVVPTVCDKTNIRQRAVADFHKMAEKDLQKLMKMRRTELLILKTPERQHSLG